MKALQILSLLTLAFSATPDQWRTRAIYHLLVDRFAKPNGDTSPCTDLSTYCGGGFQGITNNLDYITGLGFDAILLSPVLATSGDDYLGNGFTDLYQINPKYGSESDFVSMIAAAHGKGLYVMVTVEVNNMANEATSSLLPFNQTEYFHPECPISDWTNKTQIINCWFLDLPDLAQENAYVRITLLNWIQNFVHKYNIDGIKVNAVQQVSPDFWRLFNNAAGVYVMGNVPNGAFSYDADYQGVLDGVMSYPLYYNMQDWFLKSWNLYDIRQYSSSMGVFIDQGLLGNFLDTTNTTRYLSLTSNINYYQNSMAWMLTTTGIPVLFYGDEQGFKGSSAPQNHEVLWPYLTQTSSSYYQFIQKVMGLRKNTQLYNGAWVERYAQTHFYCFSRGKALMCFSNTQDTQSYSVTYLPYSQGDKVCNVLKSGDCATVGSNGIYVQLVSGECKLYQPASSLQFE